MKLVSISDELKKKSYYKYFNHPPLKELSPDEIHSLTSEPKPAEQGLEFKDRAALQDMDYVPEPSGYYLLKSGGILFSCTTKTPDLTDNMINWWFLWHQFDQLRYSLWNPEDHKSIRIVPENLQRFTDGRIPFNERLWGTHSYPTESMNGEEGGEEIDIQFVDPASQGYDDNKLGTAASLAMVVAPGVQDHGGIKVPVLMTEELRQGTDGNNIWAARWWLGYDVKNNPERAVSIPHREGIARAGAMLVVHSRKEMTHLNEVLPLLYKEYGNRPLE